MKVKLILLILIGGLQPLKAQIQGGLFVINGARLGMSSISAGNCSISLQDADFLVTPGFWVGYQYKKWMFEARGLYSNHRISSTTSYDDFSTVSDYESEGFGTDLNVQLLQGGVQYKVIGNVVTVIGGLTVSHHSACTFKFNETATNGSGLSEYITSNNQTIKTPSGFAFGPYLGSGLNITIHQFIIRSELVYTWLNATANANYEFATSTKNVTTNQLSQSSNSGFANSSMHYGYMNILVGVGFQF